MNIRGCLFVWEIALPETGRKSFTRQLMPERRACLDLNAQFSARQFTQIKAGHISQGMDDKWNIGFEEPWLYFCRSWTGCCIYQIRFETIESGARIVEAWVNRDTEQYRSPEGATFDQDFVMQLIRIRLLDKAP
ncbi:MAG TPA: hypothetical protein VJ750_07815 [Rhizomicrobium sp.]|nr:hypothetical protein [Rhizomicrobium sp.]